MKMIIALRGRGGCGKTTTIKLLPDILEKNGYQQITGIYRTYGNDIFDVYEKGGVKVGLTSSGDTHDLVEKRLSELVKYGCDICICACRTFDRKHPGTIAATKSFPSYTPQYLEKTDIRNGTTTEQDKANNTDVNKLFEIIKSFPTSG